jgi:hypothetical protein
MKYCLGDEIKNGALTDNIMGYKRNLHNFGWET